MTKEVHKERSRVDKRVERIMDFLQLLDSFKSIERRTYLSAQTRHENDAEHTWHMCMFALLLHDEVDAGANLEYTLKLILVHDLVEIYAGDTFAHDDSANVGKREREQLAAERLFSQLPQDLGDTLMSLWNQFEEGISRESKFARAIDKMQAFAQNVNSGGRVWKEHHIARDKIQGINASWNQQNDTFTQIFEYLWESAEQSNSFWSSNTGVQITVRPAVETEYDAFARVAKEVHDHHVRTVPDVFRNVHTVVSEDDFASLLRNNESQVLVAEQAGEMVGYAVVLRHRTTRDIHVPRTVAYIDNFGVLAQSRRLGVGRQLFAACVHIAKDMGAQTLELDCWEANEQAVQFYEKLGMKRKRRWYSMDL